MAIYYRGNPCHRTDLRILSASRRPRLGLYRAAAVPFLLCYIGDRLAGMAAACQKAGQVGQDPRCLARSRSVN